MNGKGHALTAALGWFAAAPRLAEALHDPVARWELAAGGIVAAGAGLAPDLDLKQATAARTFGPAGRAVAAIVGKVAGGHRGLTHKVGFPLLLGAGVAWASVHWAWAAAVVVFVVAAWAWRALGADLNFDCLGCDADALIVGALVGAAAGFYLEPGWWLPAAVALGALVHLAGDKAFGGRSPLRVGGHVEAVVVWVLQATLPVVALVQCGVLVVAR